MRVSRSPAAMRRVPWRSRATGRCTTRRMNAPSTTPTTPIRPAVIHAIWPRVSAHRRPPAAASTPPRRARPRMRVFDGDSWQSGRAQVCSFWITDRWRSTSAPCGTTDSPLRLDAARCPSHGPGRGSSGRSRNRARPSARLRPRWPTSRSRPSCRTRGSRRRRALCTRLRSVVWTRSGRLSSMPSCAARRTRSAVLLVLLRT